MLPVTAAVVAGLCWRLWLMGRYAGWEESDYGNLAMIQGVLDGGFLHYDMNHMPGYYALAAVVHAVVGDAVLAGRSVSLAGGLIALALSVKIATRIGGPRTGWVTGILLVIQPEFALYSASSLLEPVAAAFIMGTLSAIGADRLRLAGICAAGAFLVRFDAALVLGPVLLLHAYIGKDGWKRLIRAWIPLAGAVFLWALYCRLDHGTWAFWSHSVQVNLDTGLGAEAEQPGEWWKNGSLIATQLLGWLLPWRIGLVVWVGLIVGLWVALRQKHGLMRTVGAQAFLMLGLWAAIGFVGQHAASHNLYWKWLYPVVPVITPLAAYGLWLLADRVGRVMGSQAGWVLVVVSMLQASASNLRETERQRELSEAWYRPQLVLAQWIEANVADDTAMVLDNIPACWIRRRHTERPMVSWFDVPVAPGDEKGFAAWVEGEKVEWVLWFREDWTQAPRIAPFLASGGIWESGTVRLVERGREDGYGWIWFERVSP